MSKGVRNHPDGRGRRCILMASPTPLCSGVVGPYMKPIIHKAFESTQPTIGLFQAQIFFFPISLFLFVPLKIDLSRDDLPTRRMDNRKQPDISSAQAVLLGALAPGVNGQTWNTLKSAFVLLGVCLTVMLGLAFSASDSSLVLHVGFLVLITATLFLLLSWFLSQTGLVSVERQMKEMDLVPNDHSKQPKTE